MESPSTFDEDQDIVRAMNDAFGYFTDEFDQFLLDRLPNRYLYGDDIITVYARKATHLILGVPIKTFDIGTITIADRYQNRGLGMRVINHIHKHNPFRSTYIESILNDALYDRLKGHGWKDAGVGVDRNVFKMTPLTR